MVKWVCKIEFLATHEHIGKGFGGKMRMMNTLTCWLIPKFRQTLLKLIAKGLIKGVFSKLEIILLFKGIKHLLLLFCIRDTLLGFYWNAVNLRLTSGQQGQNVGVSYFEIFNSVCKSIIIKNHF